jgi:flagellar motor switch protein FliM
MRGQLTQQEIDALLAGGAGLSGDGLASSEKPLTQGEVLPFDVARLPHLVRGPMPTLDLVNQRFASHLLEALFNLAGRRFEIAAGEVRTQTYSDFVNPLSAPASCSIMSIRPLRGQALVVCEQGMVDGLLDVLFGGSGTSQPRPDGQGFSPVARRVIKRLVAVIADSYNKAWRGISPLTLALERSESQPQFANIAGADERVLATSFQLEIGEVAGAIHVCLPHASLEPIRELLHSGHQGDFMDGDQRWAAMLSQEIPSLAVTLDAKFAPLDATVGQLLAMKVGDFIGLDGERRVDATVDGVPLFECVYGTRNAKYAIRVVKGLRGPGPMGTGADNE